MKLLLVEQKRRETGGTAEGSGRGKEPWMYAAKDDAAAKAFKAQESLAGMQSVPLADRLAAAGNAGATTRQRCASLIHWMSHLCTPFYSLCCLHSLQESTCVEHVKSKLWQLVACG